MSRVRFTLECHGVGSCQVFFEPEGAEVTLPRGETFTVEIRGGNEGEPIEITYKPHGMTVWAPSRADTFVWNAAGKRLDV